jgi:SAM-dependent methyltransferase
MLTQALAKRAGEVPVTFGRADLNRPLPFPDESFDGAVCVNVLQLLAAPPRTVTEVRRVLRHHGKFLLQTPAPGARLGGLALRTDIRGLPYWLTKRAGVLLGVVRLYDPAALGRLVEKAGFVVIDSRGDRHRTTIIATRTAERLPRINH